MTACDRAGARRRPGCGCSEAQLAVWPIKDIIERRKIGGESDRECHINKRELWPAANRPASHTSKISSLRNFGVECSGPRRERAIYASRRPARGASIATSGQQPKVRLGLGERAQAHTRVVQSLGDVEQVAGRARQPVDLGHHHYYFRREAAPIFDRDRAWARPVWRERSLRRSRQQAAICARK